MQLALRKKKRILVVSTSLSYLNPRPQMWWQSDRLYKHYTPRSLQPHASLTNAMVIHIGPASVDRMEPFFILFDLHSFPFDHIVYNLNTTENPDFCYPNI